MDLVDNELSEPYSIFTYRWQHGTASQSSCSSTRTCLLLTARASRQLNQGLLRHDCCAA